MLKTILTAVLLALVCVTGYTYWYLATPMPVDKLPAAFSIPPGASFRAATQHIDQAGIGGGRSGRLRLELLARVLERTQDIKAGSYELATAPTPLELLDKLTQGDITQAEVRFVEGWNFRQLRAALDANAFVRHDSQGLGDAQLLGLLKAAETHPEGLFFPDTYLFAKGSSDLQILRRAYEAMQRHLAREWEARDPHVPYKSPYEALIMASIVEKETGRAAERGRIAGALVNRMRIGMLLQVDPTVIYGLGESFDGNLKKIHLQTDGPYNSYLRPGLPPTPIAAPGLASLQAVMRPATTNALYYVARGDGSSEFSRTLEEHNRAVRKYQLHGGR
ncbi:MAG: endolytic transglycosylase MltG [Betaproteobacteria bacterium]|nr:endolytic transglycosylase MltG [Betaproteobacteria bacterium]